VQVSLSSGVEVGVGYRWVDSSVNSSQWGVSVGNGLGSQGGGVAIRIGGSSIASGVASVAIASIGCGDDCGRGRGQTSENRDKGFHV